MEAFREENGGSKTKIQPVDFYKIINSIQQQCQRSLLTKKNQLLQKQQQKQNWLSKSKIIPPTLPKFSEADQNGITLKPSSFCGNMLNNEERLQISKKDVACEGNSQRKECKTSQGNGRNVNSCKKAKSNWKLQFRKDQLNILRYKYTHSQEEDLDSSSGEKGFKIRKMFKKLDNVGLEGYNNFTSFPLGNIDTRICYRDRLKTAEMQGALKRKYFA